MQKRRFFLLSFVLITLITFLWACKNDVGAGPTAPNFTLLDLDGQKVSLDQFRGSIVLLDFWATWCPPCRMSIPELVKLQEEHKDKGLVILGLSMDDPSQFTNEYLKAFKEKYKINYTILRVDRQVLVNYFANQNIAIPTMFIVDKDGIIRDKIVGFQPDALKESLSRLLR